MTMRRLLGVFALLLMLPVIGVNYAPAVAAQEGHPLVGTWHGTWGPNAKERHDVTLVLEFDGKAITGMMNPGPDSVRFDKVTLDPSNWSLHMEATPKAPSKAAPSPISPFSTRR